MIGKLLSRLRAAWQALTLDQWNDQIRESLRGAQSMAGPHVNADEALKVATVYSCARLLSESVATLPLHLYRRLEKGRERATEHELYRLLHDQPNPEMTAVELRGAQMMNLLFRGRAYCRKVRNGRGAIVEIWPINTDLVTERRPNPRGPRVYDVRNPESGDTETLPESAVWRTNGLSWNGVTGLDPITYAREVVGTSLGAEQFAAAMFRNAGRFSGVIQMERGLKDDEYNRFRQSWNETYTGAAKTGETPILEAGMKYQPISMTLENAQWIEGRRFSVAEICRLFRVPLHMVYDHDTQPRANMEQSGLEFVVYSLRPWLVCLEQSAARDLLFEAEKGKFYVQHLVDGLLRGDFKSRQDGYATGRQWGILSANDCREMEDKNPIEHGDEYWRPGNMVVVGAPPPAPPAVPTSDLAEPDPSGTPPLAPPEPPGKPTRTQAASPRERTLLASSASRAATRELKALRRALKADGGPTQEGLREVLDGQARFLEDALVCPPAAAAAYVERRYTEVLNLMAGPAPELEAIFDRWERELPARIFEEVACEPAEAVR